jgi:hypothetical protein
LGRFAGISLRAIPLQATLVVTFASGAKAGAPP